MLRGRQGGNRYTRAEVGDMGHTYGISLGCCEGGRVGKDMLERPGVRQATIHRIQTEHSPSLHVGGAGL